MEPRNLCYLTIFEATAGLRRKDFSSVELTEACLQRIASADDKLNSFITLTDDLAKLSKALDPNEQNLRPSFTNPFNLTGLPAISVPCGFTPGNLPAGLQIAAPPFEEITAFRVAYAYEQATEWHKRRPAL